MPEQSPFDVDFVLKQTGGDRHLMGEVLELFLTETPRMLDDVRAAVSGGEAGTIERTAHRLKGSLLAIAAHPATAEAVRLEKIGRAGSADGADDVLRCLETELDRLLPAIEGVAREG